MKVTGGSIAGKMIWIRVAGGVKVGVLAVIFRMLSPLITRRCIVDEPVENGVGNGWIGAHLVPVIEGTPAS